MQNGCSYHLDGIIILASEKLGAPEGTQEDYASWQWWDLIRHTNKTSLSSPQMSPTAHQYRCSSALGVMSKSTNRLQNLDCTSRLLCPHCGLLLTKRTKVGSFCCQRPRHSQRSLNGEYKRPWGNSTTFLTLWGLETAHIDRHTLSDASAWGCFSSTYSLCSYCWRTISTTSL